MGTDECVCPTVQDNIRTQAIVWSKLASVLTVVKLHMKHIVIANRVQTKLTVLPVITSG